VGEERRQGRGYRSASETATADLALRIRFSASVSRHADGGVCVGIGSVPVREMARLRRSICGCF
jgi:hypothetical protein